MPELIRTWLVVVRPGTVVKRLAVELPELLAELETACVTGIGPGWQPLWWGPVQQLGLWSCVSGGATPEELPGYWLLAQPTATWGSSAVAVVEACEEFLAQTADVGTKLAGAGLTERHAVVLVTPEWLGELVSIEDGVVPTRAPTLPDGVDRVWLVTLKSPPVTAVDWLADRWRRLTLTAEQVGSTAGLSVPHSAHKTAATESVGSRRIRR